MTQHHRLVLKVAEVLRLESGKTIKYTATSDSTMAMNMWSIVASFGIGLAATKRLVEPEISHPNN